jgi:hypothetical protein
VFLSFARSRCARWASSLKARALSSSLTPLTRFVFSRFASHCPFGLNPTWCAHFIPVDSQDLLPMVLNVLKSGQV